MPGLSLAERLHIDALADNLHLTFLQPHLTENNARDLAEDIADLAAWRGARHVQLDFGQVESVSSYVLMRLVVVDQKLRDVGRTLALVNLRPEIYDVFQATHLTEHLDTRPAERR